MNDARPLQTVSDQSDRSDPFGIIRLFQSDTPAPTSDRSDSAAAACPTCPTGHGASRTEIGVKEQRCPTRPTCPTAIHESEAFPPDPEADALDAYEERAAIREYDGGQPRAAAEAAALAEVAQAAGMTPQTLQRLWTDHPDARLYLAHLLRHGPATYGAMATELGWGATRAWQAEARLRAAGLVAMGPFGRAEPMTRTP